VNYSSVQAAAGGDGGVDGGATEMNYGMGGGVDGGDEGVM